MSTSGPHAHEASCSTRLTNPCHQPFHHQKKILAWPIASLLPLFLQLLEGLAEGRLVMSPNNRCMLPHSRCLFKIDIITNHAAWRATDHTTAAACLSTSSTMTRFSTYFASVDRLSWMKMRPTTLVSYEEENGAASVGGTSSYTSVEDGGPSFSRRHPTWVSVSFVHVARP